MAFEDSLPAKLFHWLPYLHDIETEEEIARSAAKREHDETTLNEESESGSITTNPDEGKERRTRQWPFTRRK
jgi:hypothetical protein